MDKHRLKKLMAYFYMPLIFAILGYGIVYLAAKPILDVGVSTISLFLSSTSPQTGADNKKTFKDPNIKDVNAQPESIGIEDISYPEYGDIYGKIVCKAVGLEADVYYGDDSQTLRSGAGQYIGSGIPGGGRQVLLAGHNVTIFAPLEAIKAGDIVTFTTSYGIYEYRITDTKILDSSDANAYDLLAKEEKLVMYTCYPFTALGSTNQRYFVYGEKIAGPRIVQGGGN